jgi:hypothetical protein
MASRNNDVLEDAKHQPVDSHCKPEELKEGEWLSGTVYYKILNPRGQSHEVEDSFGKTLTVGDSILGREMVSSCQFDREEKVTRSQMVEKLSQAKDTVFTVKFKKKLTGKRVREVMEEDDYDTQTPAKRLRILNKAVAGGEDRVLVGFLKDCEPFMGRSAAIDLNVAGPHKERQIDHRTVEELILNRIKYILK